MNTRSMALWFLFGCH